MRTEEYSVLVVTKDKNISSMMNAVMQPPMFELLICSDYNEARRILLNRNFNIIIADSGDGIDTDFAIDVSSTNASIMLLVPGQNYDQISYRVEGYGIMTIPKPFDAFFLYNMIKVAIALQFKIQFLTSQTIKLKDKMEEIKLINRAKLLLVEKKKMTEDQAHHFIEKSAMDRCITKIALAREIISES